MSTEECPHGLGDPDWCSICKHGPLKTEPVTVEYRFFARYDGHCGGCNLPISTGEACAKLSNEANVHDGCVR